MILFLGNLPREKPLDTSPHFEDGTQGKPRFYREQGESTRALIHYNINQLMKINKPQTWDSNLGREDSNFPTQPFALHPLDQGVIGRIKP